ncbi:MAG: CBS domain-containing protein [Saprospiraceae bacterium]|nr:CBS domain-containing protein [Saprospiraceae bacterium]
MINTAQITVGNLMTTLPVTVGPNDTLLKVKEIFGTMNIHHIPVIKHKKVVGIISKNDFLAISNAFPLFNEAKRESYNDKLYATLLVEEVMTKQVAKVNPEDSIEIVAGIFRENLFHALPVVDQNSELVGIITTFDLLNYFFNERLPLE